MLHLINVLQQMPYYFYYLYLYDGNFNLSTLYLEMQILKLFRNTKENIYISVWRNVYLMHDIEFL